MPPTPSPGRKVRGSTTGEPIMALLDLLGRRWVLRIIWELREESLTFRQLQQSCGAMSASVLNDRLGDLRQAEIIESGSAGYQLTDEGRRLVHAYQPINDWAQRWAARTAHG